MLWKMCLRIENETQKETAHLVNTKQMPNKYGNEIDKPADYLQSALKK